MSAETLLNFMMSENYLMMAEDGEQVASLPRHNISCPVSRVQAPRLSPGQVEEIKKMKMGARSALSLVSAAQPSTESALTKLVSGVTRVHANFVLLHNSQVYQSSVFVHHVMLSTCQGESRNLMPIPGFRSYTTTNSSLQLLVHNKQSVERIHTLDPADSSIIWVVLTEAGIISDNRGVKTDRVTLVGCCSRLGNDGDTALVSQVDSLKQKYSDHVDVMLVLVGEAVNDVSDESAVLGAVRARSAVSVAGMRVIATQGVKYDLDQVEAVSVVKQDKRLCLCCDAGFRTSQQLEEHNKTGKHRQARLYKHYQLNSERLLKNPHDLGLEIELVEQDAGIEYGSEPGLVSIVTKPKEVKKFKLKLRNGRAPEGDEDRDPSNPKGIILDRFGPAKEDSVFVFEDEKGLLAGTKLRLKYDKKMKVKVKAMSDQIGHYRVPVLVGFYHETHSDMQRDSDGDMAHVLSHMAVELLLKVQTVASEKQG